MGRTVYVLHSSVAPASVADVLRRSIDEEHWTLFSCPATEVIARYWDTGGRHHRKPSHDGDTWVGLIVPPALVLFGTVLPKVGRLLGKNDRGFVLEHLQNTLAARIEEPESQFDTALRRG